MKKFKNIIMLMFILLSSILPALSVYVETVLANEATGSINYVTESGKDDTNKKFIVEEKIYVKVENLMNSSQKSILTFPEDVTYLSEKSGDATIAIKDNQKVIIDWSSSEDKSIILIFEAKKEGTGFFQYTVNEEAEEKYSLPYIISKKTEIVPQPKEVSVTMSVTRFPETVGDVAQVGTYLDYYFNVWASTSTSLNKPTMRLSFPKAYFVKPKAGDFPGDESSDLIENYEVLPDDTDANDYVVLISYKKLGGGTSTSAPFKAMLNPYVLMDKEKVTIKQTLYDEEGAVVEARENTFTAKTGYSSVNALSSGEKNLLSKNVVSSGGKDFVSPTFPVQWSFRAYRASDKRDVIVNFPLKDGDHFDPDLEINGKKVNEGWTYDSVNKIVSRIVKHTEYSVSHTNFDFYLFLTHDDFELNLYRRYDITSYLVNEDNSLDNTTLRNSYNQILYKKKQENITFNKSLSGTIDGKQAPNIYSEENVNQTIFTSTINVGNWDSELPVGTQASFNKIDDVFYSQTVNAPIQNSWLPRENESQILLRYKVKANSTRINATEISKLASNKLIGVLPNGTSETIATNISINIDTDGTYIEIPLIDQKSYQKIQLVFNQDIIIEKKNDSSYTPAIQLLLETKISRESAEKIKNYFEKEGLFEAISKSLYASYQAQDGASVHNSSYSSAETVVGFGWQLPFAGLNSESMYATLPGNNVSQNSLNTGSIFYINDRKYLQTNLGVNFDRKTGKMKYILLIPDGINFLGFESGNNISYTSIPEIIYNYQGTGKTGILVDLEFNELKIGSSKNYGDIKARLQVSKNAVEGANQFVSYLGWENNTLSQADGISALNGVLDTYDLNGNKSTTDYILKRDLNLQIIPNKELILSTKTKNEEETGGYASVSLVDGEDVVDFSVDLMNNSNADIQDLEVVDVLPRVGDKAIVPNQEGDYPSRNSTFNAQLKGKLEEVDGYRIYYSIVTPKATLDENLKATSWVLSTNLPDDFDYSKVTMIKIVMNPDTVLKKNQTHKFRFQVTIPSAKDLVEGDQLVNSIAGAIRKPDGYGEGFESMNTYAKILKYDISGTVYLDKNKNSVHDEEERGLKNYPVTLYHTKADGNEEKIITIQTDKDGNYSFKDLFQKRGKYRVEITKDDEYIVVQSSDVDQPNDFNAVGQTKVFELTTTEKTKTLEAGIYATTGKLIVHYKEKYIDADDGTIKEREVSPANTFIGDDSTSYDEDAEAIEITDYRWKNAAGASLIGYFLEGESLEITHYYDSLVKVTVKYQDIAGNPIKAEDGNDIADMILSGVVGENYETEAKNIKGYTLQAIPINAKGKFTEESIIVIYVYEKYGTLRVQYLKKDGTNLIDDVVTQGEDSATYSTENKVFPHYRISSIEGDEMGTYKAGEEIVVKYIYENFGKVTAVYEDIAGRALTDEKEELTGEVGTNYITTKREFIGYRLVAEPTNATGTFSEEDIIVTYRYEKIPQQMPVPPHDSSSDPEMANETENSSSNSSEQVSSNTTIKNESSDSSSTSTTKSSDGVAASKQNGLPKTGEESLSYLVLIGLLLSSFVFIMLKERKRAKLNSFKG